MVRTLKVAVSGLGRMGARHAINYFEKTPRAEPASKVLPSMPTSTKC
jgi:myo-inositol 2-dehydrogenase/D-chiro-inositol 1-dehydrogenase